MVEEGLQDEFQNIVDAPSASVETSLMMSDDRNVAEAKNNARGDVIFTCSLVEAQSENTQDDNPYATRVSVLSRKENGPGAEDFETV